MARRSARPPVLAGAVLAVAAAAVLVGLVTAPGPSPHGTGAAAHVPTTVGQRENPAPAAAPAPSTTAVPGPPYAVTDETLTLVDTTRPTPARGSVPGAGERTLRTVIRKPAGATGPLPLVVFGPGFDTTPETYEVLLDGWAAAGYLVASPDFPGSGSDLPGPPTESDIEQAARDLSFVITSLLDGRVGPVDATRIAVAGHSDGGSSVVALAENPAVTDLRISAYLVMAGQIPDGVAGPWDASPAGALLCVVGSDDQYGNLQLTGAAYASARMTKAMVTVPGGDHLGIFVGSGTVADEVRATMLRFLDSALGPGRPVSDARLASALAPPAGGPTYELSTG